jgi:hypothetical protein
VGYIWERVSEDNPRAAAEKVVIMMTLEGRRDGAGLKDSRSFGPMPEGF